MLSNNVNNYLTDANKKIPSIISALLLQENGYVHILQVL